MYRVLCPVLCNVLEQIMEINNNQGEREGKEQCINYRRAKTDGQRAAPRRIVSENGSLAIDELTILFRM